LANDHGDEIRINSRFDPLLFLPSIFLSGGSNHGSPR
jgi:hypothetical protein